MFAILIRLFFYWKLTQLQASKSSPLLSVALLSIERWSVCPFFFFSFFLSSHILVVLISLRRSSSFSSSWRDLQRHAHTGKMEWWNEEWRKEKRTNKFIFQFHFILYFVLYVSLFYCIRILLKADITSNKSDIFQNKWEILSSFILIV
jgi:hypothetical protein